MKTPTLYVVRSGIYDEYGRTRGVDQPYAAMTRAYADKLADLAYWPGCCDYADVWCVPPSGERYPAYRDDRPAEPAWADLDDEIPF